NTDDAEQIQPTRTDVGRFDQEIWGRRILNGRTVFVEIRRAQVAIKHLTRQHDWRNERGKLLCRRHRGKWVCERLVLVVDPRNDVVRRQLDRAVEVEVRCARIEDTITCADYHAVGVERSVGKAKPGREVVRINTLDDALRDVGDVGQIVL